MVGLYEHSLTIFLARSQRRPTPHLVERHETYLRTPPKTSWLGSSSNCMLTGTNPHQQDGA